MVRLQESLMIRNCIGIMRLYVPLSSDIASLLNRNALKK